MIKQLSREEERLIREHTDTSAPAPSSAKVWRGLIAIALIFALLVFVGYLLLNWINTTLA